jgi:chromosome segregation ATPase
MDLMVLQRQLEAKDAVVSDLQRREADLRSTVSSLNSENAQQQQILQHHKDQLQVMSVLQRDAGKVVALQSTIEQLQEVARQREEALLLMQTRVAAAESDIESARAQLSAADERVASLKMAMKAQADAAAGSAAAAAAAAAASAVATTRTEMTQEIALITKQHANQLQQQRQQCDEYEEELRTLRDQVRLLQESIVVLNKELGDATAALHSAKQLQATSTHPSASFDISEKQVIVTLDSSDLVELRAQLTAKDREFRAVKGPNACVALVLRVPLLWAVDCPACLLFTLNCVPYC